MYPSRTVPALGYTQMPDPDPGELDAYSDLGITNIFACGNRASF